MGSTPRKRQPRKQAVQTPATPTRKRNPQRCRRCPGLPLRSECAHGYRRTAPEAEPSATEATAQAPAPVTLGAAASPSEPQPGPFPFTYASLAQLHALAVAQGLIPGAMATGAFLPPGGLVGGNTLEHPVAPQSQSQAPSFPLDPLLASPHQAPSTPPTQLPREHTPSPPPNSVSPGLESPIQRPNSPFDNQESDIDPFGSPSSPASPRKKRAYASNSNAIHGFIEGVGRGNALLDMARVRPLKPVAISRKSATRKFNRFARDLFTRAEDISNGTACWMYVAMHQPGSGHPFLHFASRRLRNEAPEELKKIHQQVGTTMTMLKRADRAQHLDHERERLEAEITAANASARADRAELELERLRQELAARDEVLSSLAQTSAQADVGSN